jgi:hypothetical protein
MRIMYCSTMHVPHEIETQIETLYEIDRLLRLFDSTHTAPLCYSLLGRMIEYVGSEYIRVVSCRKFRTKKALE